MGHPGLVVTTIRMAEGWINRVPDGKVPEIPIEHEDGEEIVSIKLRPAMFKDPKRKTVDWHWEAYFRRVT